MSQPLRICGLGVGAGEPWGATVRAAAGRASAGSLGAADASVIVAAGLDSGLATSGAVDTGTATGRGSSAGLIASAGARWKGAADVLDPLWVPALTLSVFTITGRRGSVEPMTGCGVELGVPETLPPVGPFVCPAGGFSGARTAPAVAT